MAALAGVTRRSPLLLQQQTGPSPKMNTTSCRMTTTSPKFTSVKCQYTSYHHYPEEGTVLTFWDRLLLAWRVLFPSPPKPRETTSSSSIAKQRLKMILISDRCAVSDEAKRKIVASIVSAISEVVEVESEDKVQLTVSADPDLGTIYSVTVPVRRVKPQYQQVEELPPPVESQLPDL